MDKLISSLNQTLDKLEILESTSMINDPRGAGAEAMREMIREDVYEFTQLLAERDKLNAVEFALKVKSLQERAQLYV